MNDAFRLLFSRAIVIRAVNVALVAGTLLTVVNQWQGLFLDAKLDWLKIALTYCVPYLVSSASSYLSARAHLKTLE